MPIIRVEMFEGRTIDQKKELVSQNKKINENKSIKEKPKLENRMTKNNDLIVPLPKVANSLLKGLVT